MFEANLASMLPVPDKCGLFDASVIGTESWSTVAQILGVQLFLRKTFGIYEDVDEYDDLLADNSCSPVIHPLMYACPIGQAIPVPSHSGDLEHTSFTVRLGAMTVALLNKLEM